jgi:hypothetical protein
LDESEDENSAHADEKRTEGKERGRNRRTNQLLFLICQQFEDQIKSDDEKKYTKNEIGD